MEDVLFFIAAIGAVTGAIGVIALRNPFYSVLALVVHLLSLALLFLLLEAQFVAAAQVVVYAGAVMVLYVFVVSYVGGQGEPITGVGPGLGGVGLALCVGLFVELSIALLGSGLHAIDTDGARLGPGFGTPGQIGQLLLTKFLFAFEIASYLLLVAAVGAVVLARRRRGIDAPDEPLPATARRELTAGDLLRVPRAGSQAESIGLGQEEREEQGGW
jgi:NADH:ubiquinone oxidoreductase subunit 6 (subunit J)